MSSDTPPGLSSSSSGRFNLFRDTSMKKHMERIIGLAQMSEESMPPHGISSFPVFPRCYSAAMAELHKVVCQDGKGLSTVDANGENENASAAAKTGKNDAQNNRRIYVRTSQIAGSSKSAPGSDVKNNLRIEPPNTSQRNGAETGFRNSQLALVVPGSLELATNIRHFGNGSGDCTTLAVVHMGTNAIHIAVAKADCHGQFEIIDSEREYVKLGNGGALSLITSEAEGRAFEAMKRFKALASAYGANLRVVATTAVRDAANRGAFLSKMAQKVGVDVEVLSGNKEACLIYKGVLQAMPVHDKKILVIDIGGVSTEFVIGIAGSPVFATSVKLGYMRLTDLFVGRGEDIQGKCPIADIRKYIRGILEESGVAEQVKSTGFEIVVGCSSTIETIERVINQRYVGDCATLLIHEQSNLGVSGFREREFTKNELVVVAQKFCKAKNNEHRAKTFGISGRKAEDVVGGALLLEEIISVLNVNKMMVSPYALREGVIVEELARAYGMVDTPGVVGWNSIVGLARRFYTQEIFASACHCAQLAEAIIDGLKTNSASDAHIISELDDTDIELLKASVLLHAIGMSVGFRNYHKHSHYLIKNNDILVGYSPLQIEIISLLVKYHRVKIPTKKDESFAQLPLEVQTRLRALCAIARIAVSLNRCHNNVVKTVHVIQEQDTCVLVVVPEVDSSSRKLYDVSLEMWTAQDKMDFFEKVFKRKSSIVVADHHDENALRVEQWE